MFFAAIGDVAMELDNFLFIVDAEPGLSSVEVTDRSFHEVLAPMISSLEMPFGNLVFPLLAKFKGFQPH